MSETSKFTSITLQMGKLRLWVQLGPQTLALLLKRGITKMRVYLWARYCAKDQLPAPTVPLKELSNRDQVQVPGAGHVAWGVEHGLDFSPHLPSSWVPWASAQQEQWRVAALPSTTLMRGLLFVASIYRWKK